MAQRNDVEGKIVGKLRGKHMVNGGFCFNMYSLNVNLMCDVANKTWMTDHKGVMHVA